MLSQSPPFCICLELWHTLIWIYYCCCSHWNRPLWDKGLLMHFGFAHMIHFSICRHMVWQCDNLEAGKIVNTCFALSKTRTQELALENSALFMIFKLDYAFLFEISCGFINQNHWLFIQHRSYEGLNNVLHTAWEQDVPSGCVLQVWQVGLSNRVILLSALTAEPLKRNTLGRKTAFNGYLISSKKTRKRSNNWGWSKALCINLYVAHIGILNSG